MIKAEVKGMGLSGNRQEGGSVGIVIREVAGASGEVGKETLAVIKSEFRGLLSRKPEYKVSDTRTYSEVRVSRNKMRKIVKDGELSEFTDVVKVFFRNDKGKLESVLLAQYIDRKVEGKKIIQQADTTCKQILDLSAEKGKFPEEISWTKITKISGKGGYKAESANRFISFMEIKGDMLEIAIASNPEKYGGKSLEEIVSDIRYLKTVG